MDIIDEAVYNLVHGYPGGAPNISRDLQSLFLYQVKPGTLMNKANPDQPHQLTVREGLLLQRLHKCAPLLHAEAHQLNHSVIKLGDFSDTSDTEFLNVYTAMHSELGQLADVINHAFSDGEITAAEVRQIRTRGMAAIRAILEMEQRVRALCDWRESACA